MAEKSENQTSYQTDGGSSGMEQEAEDGEVSVGYNSNLDLGFTPSERISSSVGSTEGAGLDGGFEKLADSDRNSAIDMYAPEEQESNSSIGIQILADTQPVSVPDDGILENVAGDKALEENTSTVGQHGSVDEESSYSPVDFADGKEQLDDESQFHDAGRDDMFVDAPDQLSIMSDGRSTDNGEFTAYDEPQLGSEENLGIQVVEDGNQVRQLTYELALLQASLEKTAADKEIIAQKHKEEKEMLRKEISDLQRQLETMANQQLFLNDNGNGLVDRLRQEEKNYKEGETHASDTSLPSMIADCSKSVAILKRVMEEQLQSEGTIRELHAVLFTKDQEIKNLSATVNEMSLSHNANVSYMESLHQTLSQLQESSEGQAERDLHLEVVTKKLLTSLASVVQQEELSDASSVERLSLIEKSTILMIERYRRLLSEIDQLRQCLGEVMTEANMPEDTEFGIVLDMVRKEFLDHKRMETDFTKKLSQFEYENKMLLEQLDKAKEKIDVTDGEVRKVKMELDQEKVKLSTTKEKLGMAVTKGKALVQQRDSLKQSLAEKANELEKCLLELQEKSNALESAEMRNEELIHSTSLAASQQESLSKRVSEFQEIEKILSRANIPDGLHSMDAIECVSWLADQQKELLGLSFEHNRLKSLLSSLNLPEVIGSSRPESQISWLGESLSIAEDDIMKLQGEVISAKVEVASLESELDEAINEIHRLKTTLSTETREKCSLQMGLESLLSKYEAIVDKEFRSTSEKDNMAKMLLEACGVEDQGEFHESYPDMLTFIDKCVGRIKEQITTNLSESSFARTEQFERIQSLLYVTDQEVVLCKDILEEEMLQRTEMATIANEMKRVSEEVITLKDEKDSMQKDLERSDEKTALLREKLSMAVKKGKGLVQEREGLKKSLDEKHTEIEKLKLELQQQESVVSGCKDQINRLSIDLEHFSKLESDLLAMKDQRDQLEKYLLESNKMLERVVDSVESVVLPADTVFEEPVDKIKWLADRFNEHQIGKFNADQELEKVKEDADILSGNLREALATVRSLEDAFVEAEKSNLLLVEEKKEIEISTTYLQQELDKSKEEASSQGSKFIEACANIKSLEDALNRADKNMSVLEEEKEAACLDKTCAEKELEKVKEEADNQVSKLAEAYTTIKSLEEGLSQLEKSFSILTEEKNVAEDRMTSLESELEKAKSEVGSQANKLVDAYATVKSLEDALSAAEEKTTELTTGKKNAEMEIQILNAKLSASMADLAGTHGTLQSQSAELFNHLNNLKVVLNEDNLLSTFTHGFKKKFEGLKDMNSLLEDIRDQFVERGSEQLKTNAGTERFDFQKDPHAATVFSAYIDKFTNGTINIIKTDATDLDDILSYIRIIVEGFKKKNKLLEDKFEGFSNDMDEIIAILLRALQATRENVIGTLEPVESLELDVKNLRTYQQGLENTIFKLKNDINMLLLAWSDAAEDLGFQMDNSLEDLSSNMELEKLNNGLDLRTRKASEDVEQQQERFGGKDCVVAAENIAGEVRSQIKRLENVKFLTMSSIEELQKKLKDAQLASENAMEERNLNQNRVSTLERDLQALRDLCNELKIKVAAKEDMLKEKDAELSSLHCSLETKERETQGYFLSEDQIKMLIEKIDQIEILSEEPDLGKQEFHYSGPVKKLFVIIDNITQLQHQMRLLSQDNEELQSSLARQGDEIERLEKEAESLLSINQDLGNTKSDLTELIMDLEKLIQKFGGNDHICDKKFGVKGFLTVLEDLVMASIRECEASKSKAQESGAKLHENQKVVNELSEKVKLLEDSIQSRSALPDGMQERTIFKESLLPSGSEITEIEDAAPLGRSSVSPVPAAALRTMRKGSSDHLALTIDSESDRLINHHEIDDDKGHAFKSLNTSGLIPKQGKLMADRVDGIWVSGGRALMSRPRARLGLIAYSLLLHLWLLGTVL